jgi:GT2 family glycosyltransferase
MKVSIIIAHYNGKDLLKTCLSALLPQVEDPSSVMVVDNGSSDGSQEYISDAWPMVTGLFLGSNTGFTGANNAGAASGESEFIVLLNNDTRISTGWFENLLAPMDDPSVGAVSSSMRRMGSPEIMDSAGGGMDHLGYTFDLGRGEPASHWTDAGEIMAPCGGAMALRRSALEDRKTVFWDRLFLYNEDTDLGFRLWKNGFRVVYEPSAVVEHAMSATAGTTSPARTRYCTRNRILVLRRHLGRDFGRIAPTLACWEAMLLGYLLARGRIEAFRNSLAGFRQAFIGGVAPYGDPLTARRLLARFMTPACGTALRRRMGEGVYRRIIP